MTGISMVVPCELNRLPLFEKSLTRYAELTIPADFEIVVVSRTIPALPFDLPWPMRLITYKYRGPLLNGAEIFNPTKALNLGVKNSKYHNVIITCPEVRPISDVLAQFTSMERGNYVCQAFDVDVHGNRESFVNSTYRSGHPGFYFLAIYRKEDIEKINGWGNVYMKGYSWEDNSFGERFVRSGSVFQVRDEIMVEHQYHPRTFTADNAYTEINKQTLIKERELGVMSYPDGLREVNAD